MAAELTKRIQGTPSQKRLELMIGDVIKTDLPYFDVCISNTPYQVRLCHFSNDTSQFQYFMVDNGSSQISSPLVFKLLSLPRPPRTCILTFQREFASRLFALPGSPLYSRLSVNAQMWATITHIMKIGRNNFRPPPQVESSVVRLVPKNPRPGVSFEEWDGMLRVCFGRKNRTLRAGWLGVRSVMEMVEANWRGWCALNGIAVEEEEKEGVEDGIGPMENTVNMEDEDREEEWDGIMDVDEEDELPDFFKEEQEREKPQRGKSRKKKGKVAELVREKVRKVLEDDTKLADRRARNCDEGDFLRLLWAFNNEGIHFN